MNRALLCLVAVVITSCNTTKQKQVASMEREAALWSRVADDPPTYIPKGYPTAAPRSQAQGEWFSSNRNGTRFFVPDEGEDDDSDGEGINTGAPNIIAPGEPSPGDPDAPAHVIEREAYSLRLAERFWSPSPVERPQVDPELTRLHWPERSAEVVRYSALRIERWLSPNGALREWARLCMRVGVILLALGLLVVPPVSMVLRGVSDWSGYLKGALLNVSDTVMGLPPIVIAAVVLLIGGRFMQRRWMGRKRPAYREREHDPYEM